MRRLRMSGMVQNIETPHSERQRLSTWSLHTYVCSCLRIYRSRSDRSAAAPCLFFCAINNKLLVASLFPCKGVSEMARIDAYCFCSPRIVLPDSLLFSILSRKGRRSIAAKHEKCMCPRIWDLRDPDIQGLFALQLTSQNRTSCYHSPGIHHEVYQLSTKARTTTQKCLLYLQARPL